MPHISSHHQGYSQSRLNHLLKRGEKWVTQRLQSWKRQDLRICKKILQWFTEKILPINNILLTIHMVALWSNAFKHGIRGYNDKGMTWRWRPPPRLHGFIMSNLLELLDSETSIYMTIHQLGK